MRTLKRVLIIVAIAIPGAPLHAADPISIDCPTTITPPSEGFTAPQEWIAFWEDGIQEPLAGAEIRSGISPDRHLSTLIRSKISLRNTYSNKFSERKVEAFWDLSAVKKQSKTFWISCHYFSTSLELYRALPSSIHSCRMIAQDYNVGNPGNPMTIRCQ